MKLLFVPAQAPRVWLTMYCLVLGLVAGCVLAAMARGEVPALRDALQFYYPFEVWLDAQRATGNWLPQYNPLDGTGVNLIGETSSALFYPGRVLWWIPALSVAQRMWIVTIVHIAIAAGGAAYAARRMGLGWIAAAFAATAYALSTPVFFQHINPIYLIGAAYCPWALAECWVLVYYESGTKSAPSVGADATGQSSSSGNNSSTRPRAWVWVAACSMMLLGGDPQSTAGAGIIAAAAVATRAVMLRSRRDALRHSLWLLRATAIVVGLTSVQWVPAYQWYRHSQRVVVLDLQPDADGTAVSQIPTLVRPLSDTADRTASRESPTSRYAFSIAPWHLLTLIWGTGGGHYLPANSRWMQACAAEPRMWIPSLSIGLAPFVFVVASWSSRAARRSQTFLLLVVLLSGAAMLGNYAPLWALRQLCRWCGAQSWPNGWPSDEVGGAYWIFTQIVPGYSAFRYPGKWSVWFVCALALCAAHALDRLPELRRTLARLCLSIAITSSLGLLGVCWILWQPGQSTFAALTHWLARAEADPWLGRPESAAVVHVWLTALAVALGIAIGCYVVARSNASLRTLKGATVVLTLLELVYAAALWTVTVDPPVALQSLQIESPTDIVPSNAPVRGWANAGYANFQRDWAPDLESAPVQANAQRQRVEELTRYQAAFQLGKLHLLTHKRGNLAAMHSLTPHALAAVRQRLAQTDRLRAVNPLLDESLAWLGVSQRLVKDDGLHWQSVLHARPLVELVSANGEESNGAVNIEDFDADALRLLVECESPSVVVVRLLQDGGWSARLSQVAKDEKHNDEKHAVPIRSFHFDSRSIKPQSTHIGLFQSLSVPSGDWLIELSYESPGLRLGAVITALTAVVIVLTAVKAIRQYQHSSARPCIPENDLR